MSFIFDALRKSQSSRQQHSGPGTVAVETAPSTPQTQGWLTIVAAIVVLNLIVVAFFAWYIMREQSGAAAGAADSAQVVHQAESADSAEAAIAVPPRSKQASERAAMGRGEVRPLSSEVRDERAQATARPETQISAPAGTTETARAPTPTPSETAGFLPTLAELTLDQRIQLSPLHIDVHVYNENPQRRFVLINARKYKEGERLSEGPLLEEIRRDGLVMYYRDQRFIVPRD